MHKMVDEMSMVDGGLDMHSYPLPAILDTVLSVVVLVAGCRLHPHEVFLISSC